MDKSAQINVLFGIPFHNASLETVLNEAVKSLETPKSSYMTPVDLNLAEAANESPDLKQIVFHAEKIFCESRSITWIAKLFGAPKIHNIPPEEFYPRLLRHCEKQGLSIYLFGQELHELRRTCKSIEKHYPKLKIAGRKSHPSGNIFHWDNIELINEISESKPDLLLCALFPLKGERWIYAHQRQLPSKLAFNLGHNFNPLIGKKKPYSLTAKFKSLKFLASEGLKQRKALRQIASDISTLEPEPIISSHIFHRINWSGKVEQIALGDVAMPQDYTRNVVCDASAVTFIDSAGLGQLAHMTRACSREGKFFCLYNPSDVVKETIYAMKLERHIPIVWSNDELEDELKRHEESLVLIKVSDNGHDYVVKPLVDLKPKSLEKIEKDIFALQPSLSKYGKFVLNMEYIDFIDSGAIGSILSIKNQLNKDGIEFVVANVTGVPLRTLQALRLSNILVEAMELEVLS